MKYGNQKKKVIFDDFDHRYAQLKVRLRHDGLTQSQFFQSIVSGYLDKNEHIVKYISTIQESLSKHGRKRLTGNARLVSKGRQIEKDFSLSKSDKDKLFDLIASEEGDL